MKQCALSRISKAAKSAEPISVDDKQKLWDEGVLGEFQPDQLRSTVMYLLGLTFALRGCREQRALRYPPHDPQITVHIDTEGKEYLLYAEDVHTKTNQGGLKTRKSTQKKVKAYGYSVRPQHCPTLQEVCQSFARQIDIKCTIQVFFVEG